MTTATPPMAIQGNGESLAAWMRGNRDLLHERAAEVGAVLLGGFTVGDAAAFDEACAAFCPTWGTTSAAARRATSWRSTSGASRWWAS